VACVAEGAQDSYAPGAWAAAANYLLFVGGLLAFLAWPYRMIAASFIVTMLCFTLATGVLGDAWLRLSSEPLFMLVGGAGASHLLSKLGWPAAQTKAVAPSRNMATCRGRRTCESRRSSTAQSTTPNVWNFGLSRHRVFGRRLGG
jgi:hypothetical protein